MQRLDRLWWIVRELRRLPEYSAQADRLYKELRTNTVPQETLVPREPRLERQRRDGKRVALAGLAALIITWYFVAGGPLGAAVVR